MTVTTATCSCSSVSEEVILKHNVTVPILIYDEMVVRITLNKKTTVIVDLHSPAKNEWIRDDVKFANAIRDGMFIND